MSEGSATPGSLVAMFTAMGRMSGHDWPTRLRLWSGLTMFTFVATHFVHHSLGLISLPVMEDGLLFFLTIWTSTLGIAVLSAALLTHVTLVSFKVVSRVTLRLPAVEVVRHALGMTTLTLLSMHMAANYYLFAVREVSHGYALYLYRVWPWAWPIQVLLLLSAWIHGCIGVHLWLRLRPAYRRIQPILLAVAILLPAAAIAGLLSAREVVLAQAQDPKWASSVLEDPGFTADLRGALIRLNLAVVAVVLLLIAGVFGLHYVLVLRKRSRGVRVRYPGRVVMVPRGSTVLEASRMHGIPHASVCGGRGRCSTCRVRVAAGAEKLPPPSEDELKVLGRISAPEDVRLACQIRCDADLEVVPLVPPTVGPDAARPQGRFVFGTEVEIAILFSDIRGFTSLSEKTLPYDVVHLLNQYFEQMSEAIVAHHGYVDKFIGDGMMALFGLTQGAATGCRNALAAARDMSGRLKDLNARLGHTLREPLKIGIGIHVGTAIVGEMGHKTAAALTAVGDAVNTASRVEGLTKKTGTELVVTQRVADLAAVDFSAFKRYRAPVKGKTELLRIYAMPSAMDLPEWLTRTPGKLTVVAPPAPAQPSTRPAG